ncbi:MAG: NFACT family protein [Nanoarchaeota archaeon]
MQYQLSAFDLHFLIKELKETLLNARADKVFQPSKKDFLFTFHVPARGKHMLKVMLPNVMYMTEFKEEMPTHPLHFCLFLRKHLSGAFLRDIRQFGFERVVDFVFETKEKELHLIMEFFSKGNVVLTEGDLNIKSLLETQNWKDRTLRGNVLYDYPKKKYNSLKILYEEFFECVEESDKEAIVKTLALDLGLGGRYAEEICYRAGVDKNKFYIEDEEKQKLFSELEKFRNEPLNPQVIFENEEAKTIIPVELKSIDTSNAKKFDTFNSALDNVFATVKIDVEKGKKLAPYEKEKRKIEAQIKQQEEHIKKLELEAQENQKKGELLYNNYQVIEPLLNDLNKIIKKHPQKEIKEKLKGHETIKDINFKDKKVSIEID